MIKNMVKRFKYERREENTDKKSTPDITEDIAKKRGGIHKVTKDGMTIFQEETVV